MELSLEDWRPGFARRATNFAEVCDKALSFQWEPGINCARIKDAIMVGTPDLSAGERCVLAALAVYLNEERLEQSKAYVWPSAKLIGRQLGMSESTVRAHRKKLETKGYLVRDYNRANRPAGEEAYDLAATCARLDELEEREASARLSIAEERASWRENVVNIGKYRAQAPKSQRLEQSHTNSFGRSVHAIAAPKARSDLQGRQATPDEARQLEDQGDQRLESRTDSAECSPKGASGFSGSKKQSSSHAEMVRSELQAAVAVSKRVAGLVPAHVLENPATVTKQMVQDWAFAAQRILPEPERNNGDTFMWAFRRHGVRALSMLAVALEDETVANTCQYFGWMASREARYAPDLRLNLTRIRRQQARAERAVGEPVISRPGGDDQVWREIDRKIRERMREGAYGSWFSQIGYHGVADGILQLSVVTGIAADEIKSKYADLVVAAAQEVDPTINRLFLTVRRAGKH